LVTVVIPPDIQRLNFTPDTVAGSAVAKSAPTEPTLAGVSLSTAGGRGEIVGGTEKATVTVDNSSDLNALVEALAFTNLGEQLTLKNSNFSNPGALVIDLGDSVDRTLTLQNTTLASDIIKVRSFAGAGRDSLLIDGGRFDAGQLIRLYGEGLGTVRFRGNIQLNSPVTDIAGKRVTVDTGGSVTGSGAVNVHTDKADFNKANFGTLSGAGGLTVGPHAGRRGF
jgi:hypothetical protein